MGIYLNPDNEGFFTSVRSKIYIDKTDLIDHTNQILDTEDKFISVSRPRRFGKSMAAKMLVAYYSRGCNSYELFQNYKIAEKDSFLRHLNQYDVIRLDMQLIRSTAMNEGYRNKILFYLQEKVLEELRQIYGTFLTGKEKSLAGAFQQLHASDGKKFVVIIDEWDCIFREEKENQELQKEYITFLRSLFKGSAAEECIHLAYITGILPIKKYGTESALNNFNEYTMINPKGLTDYVGFTENEVEELCKKYAMDFSEAQHWYDGYFFKEKIHIYNPRSIVQAMLNGEFENYWTQTETYEGLKSYIDLNFDGLKDAIIYMVGGGRREIDTGAFQNDMTSFRSKDDILTLLVHLGYLAYNKYRKEVYIPNEEIREEFIRAVKNSGWEKIVKIFSDSKELLEATWALNSDKVAEKIDEVHLSSVSVLNYNDENALSCVITLAYISARAEYMLIREFPSGKGFADVVFLPYSYSNKPAMIIELKWNKRAEGAIAQIKDKKYVKALEGYAGDLLLVGINYQKKSKKHDCIIEKVEREGRL